MSTFVRLYCGTCGAQLRYKTKDYVHANYTKTCAEIRPIKVVAS